MPEISNQPSTGLQPGYRPGRVDLRTVVVFSLCALLGGVAILYPTAALGCVAGAAMLGLCWFALRYMRRIGLELWQVLLLISLTGYLVLNYGYENVAFHIGGFPIIISYGMVYGALALAVLSHQNLVGKTLREPALVCVLAILALSGLHLIVDFPAYGVWALRDCSMCFDALFLILGLVWAMQEDSTQFLGKWLILVFALNMVYSFTLPWGEQLSAWSPQSGVFLQVPLLGNYNGAGDTLLAGAVFCICVGGYIMSRPRWLMLALVLGQLLGIAITQVRRMYLGIVVVIVILIVVGEIKKFAKLFIFVPVAIGVMVLVTTVGGLEISGRIGPVNLSFFKDHIRSITGAEDTPGSDPESRVIMGNEAMGHFRAHPIFGEGFGQPLLTIIDETNGAVTRMPHNSSITYLARLGLVGFTVWLAFHFCIVKRFFYAYRHRQFADKKIYAFVLWFFLYYVLFMLVSLVEAPFEFPSSAVPFYFLMGYGLGLIRWHLLPKGKERRPSLAPAV